MPEGRPTKDGLAVPRKRTIFPSDSDSLVALFKDDIIQEWQKRLGKTEDEISMGRKTNIPGWMEFMAAHILEFLVNAGVTTEGRGFDLTSVNTGTFSRDFLDSDTVYRSYVKRVNELRLTACRLGGNIPTTRSTVPGPMGDPGPRGRRGSVWYSGSTPPAETNLTDLQDLDRYLRKGAKHGNMWKGCG